MGMIANYQFLSDKNLSELKSFNSENDDIFDEVETWNEEAELLLDIDKMWDVLHFVLTGVDSSKPVENNPLSESVVGVTPIDNVDEFVSYTQKTKVEDIVLALENFDMEKAMQTFSMEECKKADLYPNIWDYEDEINEIKEDITSCFQNLKDFYKKILELNGNVLITIY